jgi:hypothetical protein
MKSFKSTGKCLPGEESEALEVGRARKGEILERSR